MGRNMKPAAGMFRFLLTQGLFYGAVTVAVL